MRGERPRIIHVVYRKSPVKTIFTYRGGYSLSFTESGNPGSIPLLIQHGMIASIDAPRLFDCLIEAGARLITIARPGYGESSPYIMKNIGEWGEIVSGLVDALGLEQFDVFGISSGAPYSYAIGHRFPDRVRRIFILSGTPALYDDRILSAWPYPVNKTAGLAELQKLAHNLFFAHLSQSDLEKDDIRDSMANDCFGIAQDLKIRCLDWGFTLDEIRPRVYMRHSRADESVPLVAAELTAGLLPNCRLEIREDDAHFSQEVLDDFISSVMTEHFKH